ASSCDAKREESKVSLTLLGVERRKPGKTKQSLFRPALRQGALDVTKGVRSATVLIVPKRTTLRRDRPTRGDLHDSRTLRTLRWFWKTPVFALQRSWILRTREHSLS